MLAMLGRVWGTAGVHTVLAQGKGKLLGGRQTDHVGDEEQR